MERNAEKLTLKSVQDKIVGHRFADALADLSRLLQSDPKNVEALYMRAVCHRYMRNFDAALEAIQALKAVSPEHGRAHQEEGHTCRDMGRADDALRAYERATRFNPALVASWKEQLAILSRNGRQRQAEIVAAQLDMLQNLPPVLLGVIDLISQGRVLKAEEICRQFLQKVPHHVEAMRLLADIGVRLGVLDDAEFLLESALKIDPGNVRARIDYVSTLRKRQKFAMALAEAKKLLDLSPDKPQFQSIYAIECMQSGDYDSAITMFDRVLGQLPGDPITLTSKGHAYKTCGRYDDAVAAYRDALASTPQYGEAYYALSNLKIYTFDDDEIARMKDHENNPGLPFNDRIHLCFALGKAYEDRQAFETSFRYYERGNRLKKLQTTYDAGRMSEDLRAQRSVCTSDFFAERHAVGHDAPDPIFVVGLPRAGSTLLEQILSSHSLVDGTLELPNVLSLSQRLRREGQRSGADAYPKILDTLDAGDFAEFGRAYIEDTRIHRQAAPFFIDKMPNNFRHIGLIHLMLPNAKIIDARRDPMACCFSGFKQLFAEGQEFTYSLDDAGRYYRDYVELMAHWDDVLPGKVLRVQYENVVADLETEVRRILDYCGLEFEPACMEFYRTDRSVRTPSSEQVRQPIFTSGLDYWKNYEPWLTPLKTSLGQAERRESGTA